MSDEREIETMNTSSVDLICCALGALLLVMLFVATLVKVTADRAAGGVDQKAANGLGVQADPDDGYQYAPADPLIVTLVWEGSAKYPPELKAYPPGKNTAGELVNQNKVYISEKTGFVIGPTGDRHFGFFDRSMPSEGYAQIRLVIPGGARCRTRDEAMNGKQSLEESHLRYWLFEVHQPSSITVSSKGAISRLLSHFTNKPPQFDLAVRSNDVNRIKLKDLFAIQIATGKIQRPPSAVSANDLREYIRNTAKIKASVSALASEDELAASITNIETIRPTQVVWVDGFEPKSGNTDYRLHRLWRDIIFPELVLAAILPPKTDDEKLAEAIRIIHVIEEGIEKANKQLTVGVPPLDWTVVLDRSGSVNKAIPESADWLAELKKYTDAFVGANPKQGGDVTVRLTVKAFPLGEEKWIYNNDPSPTLKPDDTFKFSPPN